MISPKKAISTLFLFLISGFFTSLYAQSLVDKAWEAFGKNDFKSAEQLFKQYTIQNPNDTRGFIGLSLVYDVLHKKRDSWNAFKNVLRTEKEPMPYFFFAMDNAKNIRLRVRYNNRCMANSGKNFSEWR